MYRERETNSLHFNSVNEPNENRLDKDHLFAQYCSV
jgi:hypothetical protein